MRTPTIFGAWDSGGRPVVARNSIRSAWLLSRAEGRQVIRCRPGPSILKSRPQGFTVVE